VAYDIEQFVQWIYFIYENDDSGNEINESKEDQQDFLHGQMYLLRLFFKLPQLLQFHLLFVPVSTAHTPSS